MTLRVVISWPYSDSPTRCIQQNNSQVLKVLENFRIWICRIFEFFWLPKAKNACNKLPPDYDRNLVGGRRYCSIVQER